jgi:NitT/TauT family transport system substrate-binding protein
MSANRDLGVRFMRAYLRAVRYYYGALKGGKLAGDNAEEIIQVLTEYTPIKDPQVYRTIVPNGIDPDGKVYIPTLKEDYEVYKSRGWIEGTATVEDVVDMSFVEVALKDLGPYKRG